MEFIQSTILQDIVDIDAVMQPFLGKWIAATRNGTTGAGHTFESVILHKEEDNGAVSDYLNKEIKTSRANKVRMATMCGGEETRLLSRHGYFTKGNNDISVMYKQFRVDKPMKLPCGKTALLHIIEDQSGVALKIENEIYGSWLFEDFLDLIKNKLDRFVVVGYEQKIIEQRIHFRYNKADLFVSLSIDALKAAFAAKKIAIEFRIRQGYPHEPFAVRDRGTAINVSHKDLKSIYVNHCKLSWDNQKRLEIS